MGASSNSIRALKEVTLVTAEKIAIILSADRVGQSIQLSWADNVPNFAANIYTSNWPDPDLPIDALPNLEHWVLEPVAIVGASATAKGSDLIHLGNNNARWILVWFDATIGGPVKIYGHERG